MIPIKNIYYMLSYAFRALNGKGYQRLETEKFDNIFELYAAILIRGVSLQLKRGLVKEYIKKEEATSAIKGKIDISESIKINTMIDNQMMCQYDIYSENSYVNSILKTTMVLLLKEDINRERKKSLKKLLMYFSEVHILNVPTINWKVHYNRNNHHYQLLLAICHSVMRERLQTQIQGEQKMLEVSDDQSMNRLYEKFILEYYKKEFPNFKTTSSQIEWQLDNDYNDMLPRMQTDIMLIGGNKVLIIDAKYYKKSVQNYYDTTKNHSANLYQMFTYVKNKEVALRNGNYEIVGLILYAKTDEAIVPNNSYQMSGNRIDVRTLDLNCEFIEIEEQLVEIAKIIN